MYDYERGIDNLPQIDPANIADQIIVFHYGIKIPNGITNSLPLLGTIKHNNYRYLAFQLDIVWLFDEFIVINKTTHKILVPKKYHWDWHAYALSPIKDNLSIMYKMKRQVYLNKQYNIGLNQLTLLICKSYRIENLYGITNNKYKLS
jgi:hypothetical protein